MPEQESRQGCSLGRYPLRKNRSCRRHKSSWFAQKDFVVAYNWFPHRISSRSNQRSEEKTSTEWELLQSCFRMRAVSLSWQSRNFYRFATSCQSTCYNECKHNRQETSSTGEIFRTSWNILLNGFLEKVSSDCDMSQFVSCLNRQLDTKWFCSFACLLACTRNNQRLWSTWFLQNNISLGELVLVTGTGLGSATMSVVSLKIFQWTMNEY